MSESKTNENPPLRIGLLVDGDVIPAWAYRMLERIQNGQYAEIVAIVEREVATDGVSQNRPNKPSFSSLVSKACFRLHQRLDRPKKRDRDPMDKMRLADIVGDARRIRARVTLTRWSDRVIEEDLQDIRDANLDVLIRLGFRILRGGILSAARYGVWSFHHGDNRVNRGGPPAYWEVAQHEPVTGATLQILTERLDDGIVLARTASRTNPNSCSLNRQELYWQALSLIPRELEKLHRHGGDGFEEFVQRQKQKLNFYDQPLYSVRSRTGSKALSHLASWLWRRLRTKFHSKFYRDQWELRYSIDPEGGSSFWRFKSLVPPNDRYWADPCAIKYNEKYYVFIEDFDAKSRIGHVSVLTINADGKLEAYDKALQRPYHLSYPYVFEHKGSFYMIPETGANRSIEIYRSEGFPFDWQLVRTVFDDIYAVDATLHQCDNGLWWLFANVVENEGASSSSELFLFYTDEDPVTGEWHTHPDSPIVSDVTKARPAGPLFRQGGRLYRPAQDCSRRYGSGLVMNEITELAPNRYREREETRIYPNWDPMLRGTHTFCRSGNLTIIDVVRYVPRWNSLRHLPDWLHNRLSLPY